MPGTKKFYDLQGNLLDNSGANPKSAEQVSSDFNQAGKEAIPYSARLLGESLPAIGGGVGAIAGPEGTIPGAVLGSSLKGLLQQYAPSLFGRDKSSTPIDAAMDIGKDAFLQGAVPEGISQLGAMGARQLITRAIASKFISKFPAVEEGINGVRTNQLLNETPLGENAHVREVLGAGMKGGKISNPDAILDKLSSGGYENTISPETQNAIKDLVSNIPSSSAKNGEGILRYTKNGRLMLSGTAALFGSIFGHPGTTAMGAYLTDMGLAKLMSNPYTAKLVTLALKTKASAPEASLINRILTNSLRGTEGALEATQE